MPLKSKRNWKSILKYLIGLILAYIIYLMLKKPVKLLNYTFTNSSLEIHHYNDSITDKKLSLLLD